MNKKRIYFIKLLHGMFVFLQIFLLMLMVISLLSQGKRYINKQHHVYTPAELQYVVTHQKPKQYLCYEKKIKDDDTDLVLLCVGETACYWKQEDIDKYVVENTIETSIATLSFSVRRSGLDKWIHRNNRVTYVKYGCKGEDAFSDEEVTYYAELAARKMTYDIYSEWGFEETGAYEDFVENQDRYRER